MGSIRASTGLKAKGPTKYKGGVLNGHGKNYGKTVTKMSKGGSVTKGRKK
tara:strand:+ start:363 stop:512 length:150 start_codon:yes stop_codon:yes gene_type:complete